MSGRGGQHQQEGDGQGRLAGLQRAVFQHLLQVDEQQEPAADDGDVEGEGDKVDGGNSRDANSSSGSKGSRRRASTATKATIMTTPPAAAPTTSGEAPRTGPSIRAKVCPPSPPATSSAPEASTPVASGSRVSGTCWAAATTAAASGRLSRNTQRHDTASMSQPPRKGPAATPTPDHPDQARWRGRDRPGGSSPR